MRSDSSPLAVTMMIGIEAVLASDAHGAADFEPIEARQHQVEQQQIGRRLADLRDDFAPGRRRRRPRSRPSADSARASVAMSGSSSATRIRLIGGQYRPLGCASRSDRFAVGPSLPFRVRRSTALRVGSLRAPRTLD